MKKIKILIYLFISFFQKINSKFIQNEINCYFDNNYDLNQVTEIHPIQIQQNYHHLSIFIDLINISNDIQLILKLKNSKEILHKIFLLNSFNKYESNITVNNLCKKKILEKDKLIDDYFKTEINDLIIIPIINKNSEFNNSDILGSICSIDINSKRPVLGILEINPNKINDINIIKIIHQIFHIMGFNYRYIKNFSKYETFANKLLKSEVEKKTIYLPNCLKTYDKIFGKCIKREELFNYNNNKIKYSSHWFLTNVIQDIMNLEQKNRFFITELEFSFFEDNNWYKPDMSICGIKTYEEYYLEKNVFEIFIEKNELHCFLNNYQKKKCIKTKYFDLPNYFIPIKYQSNNDFICSNVLFDMDKGFKEIKNKKIQTLTLISPKSNKCKCYPKTLFFEYDKTIPKNEEIKNFILEKINISDPNFMVFYKTSNRLKEYEALLSVFQQNNLIKVENSYLTNIIFKKYFFARQLDNLYLKIHGYQIYNHFLLEDELGSKDRLYYHYRKFKNVYPNDYNYHPESFILPEDYNLIKEKFKNYKVSKDNIWLIKPEKGSLAIGIKFIYNFKDIPKKGFISRYIHNPHLLNGTKYHLRLYVLITGYSPMKLYLFNEGQVMRASEKYDNELDKLKNKNSIFTNFFVTSRSKEYIHDINFDSEKGSEWSVSTLRKYFLKRGINFDEVIWAQIKDIVIKTQMTIQNEERRILKEFNNLKNNNLFQFYGIDVMIDDKLKVWLLEYNISPFIEMYNIINQINKKKLIADIYNLVGVIPFSHNEPEKLLDNLQCNYSNKLEKIMNETLCEFSRPKGGFERIFPIKKTLSYYKKFFLEPDEENLNLWNIIENSENTI